MRRQAICKYRTFIDQAISLVIEVIRNNDGDLIFYTDDDWDLCSDDKFDEYYMNFIAELEENSKIYDNSIIKEYIESEFSYSDDPCYYYAPGEEGILDYNFFEYDERLSDKAIIKRGIYIDKLLNIKQNIRHHLENIAQIRLNCNAKTVNQGTNKDIDILNNAKEFKVNRKFKSSMTQAQLSTMFRLMRDKGIFQASNTQLATFITSLVGGSHQTTRALLGGENAKHINMTLTNKTQVEEIQNVFRELVNRLEEEKKDLIE